MLFPERDAEATMALLTISQAAAEVGVNPKTLRSWADKGLVPVTMLPSGYRRWSPEQIAEIKRRMVVERGAKGDV
jgi:DNA-binding transcriptional MerR regulator